MSNTFIPQAVEIVKQAIEADGAGEYEKALPLYRRSLEYFMTGLKYEQNPAGENENIPMEHCGSFISYRMQGLRCPSSKGFLMSDTTDIDCRY